ncbi:MAG: hypothetical protein OXN84_00310, partial [Albidovulum sp.]|nr:hypothetical protein [Albidovulum sp.]
GPTRCRAERGGAMTRSKILREGAKPKRHEVQNGFPANLSLYVADASVIADLAYRGRILAQCAGGAVRVAGDGFQNRH